LGYEADHLPPSGAKVKNEWGYTSSTSCAFMGSIGTTLLRIDIKLNPCLWTYDLKDVTEKLISGI
jgi:hypothetical protein